MIRVTSPYKIAGLAFFGSVFLYNAILQQKQAVRNYADSLIKTFKDPIPYFCWKKKDNVQLLNCYLKEGKDAIVIPREELPGFLAGLQEYQDQARRAQYTYNVAIALLIYSGINCLFSWAERIGRGSLHST